MTTTGNSADGKATGKMAKAFLHVVDEDWSGYDRAGGGSSSAPQSGVDFVFNFNPETVSVEKATVFKEHRSQGLDSGEKEWTHGVSRTLHLGQLYFDTYEDKENVRTRYIDRLEALAHFDPELHRPPKVLFQWGRFMAENDEYNSCSWYVKKVSVEYVMFLSDGTPVRAKVGLELTEATTADRQLRKDKQSPDQAKVVIVTRGDTLASIAYRGYHDPTQWRRIASANDIDDPFKLVPGTRLLVPPILK